MLNYVILNDVDKLDHFTKNADNGKVLPVSDCIKFLKKCAAQYPQVKEASALSDNPTEKEVYAAIRRTRTVLMSDIL